MGCLSPTIVFKSPYAFKAPCRYCPQCIASRVSAYTFKVEMARKSPISVKYGDCFVTLTYNDRNLPLSDSGYCTLVKDDLQRFFKRLRISLQRAGYMVPLKYVSCGEYGDKGRCHYHVCLLGVSASVVKPFLRSAWSDKKYGGLVDVRPLDSGAIGYVCKYLGKSHPYGVVLDEYNARGAIPPFVLSSKGLSKEWIFNHAKAIVQAKYLYRDSKGNMRLYPKDVRDYVHSITGVDPRPYVQSYLKTIDTKGMTFDEFQCFNDYNNYRENYIKGIKSGKAQYKLSHCRMPARYRVSNNTDYVSLAKIA